MGEFNTTVPSGVIGVKYGEYHGVIVWMIFEIIAMIGGVCTSVRIEGEIYASIF